MTRHSGLQQDVLKLYRGFFRIIKQKELGDGTLKVIRETFRQRATQINHRDLPTIEYFLRLGRRQLENLEKGRIRGMASWPSSLSQR